MWVKQYTSVRAPRVQGKKRPEFRDLCAMSAFSGASQTLTEEEKARYDRQIRVWGAEAQTRIQNAKVLIIGLNGVHPEVVKNIVLAGVGVVLMDKRTVMASDLAYNFFLTAEDVGKEAAQASAPRIQELNSFASVTVEGRDLREIDNDYLQQFTEVLVSGGACCDMATALRINHACRKSEGSIPFFWSSIGGNEGLFVSDFGPNFVFTRKVPSSLGKETSDLTEARKRPTSSPSSSHHEGNAEKEEEQREQTAVSFPSLEDVITKPWCQIKVRKMPAPVSLAKCQLMAFLTEIDGQGKKRIASEDRQAFVATKVKENGVADDFIVQGGDAEEACNRLALLPRYPSVTICSTLGSFLAQEVIKGISRTSAPNFNASVCPGDGQGIVVYPINDGMTSPV
jgi:molybdopterin/thiamine biosynthesis adenylyltransferase